MFSRLYSATLPGKTFYMEEAKQIDVPTLRKWLEEKKKLTVVDIRPADEKKEWYIPGSVSIDAYQKLKQGDADALKGLNVDQDAPVITVCAGGRTSMIAAELLEKKGYEAYSLKGGMKAWSLAWNTAHLSFEGFEVVQVRRAGKGCLSYILASGNEAAIIDASLSIEAYEEILTHKNWKLTKLIETHIHADHLSRSKQLAEKYAVPLLLPSQSNVMYKHEKIESNQQFYVGKTAIEALPTPGHTLESMCYLVNKKVLISGDTLFINTVGRPDLKADKDEAKRKAELLYDSLQTIMALPESVIVLPAHINVPPEFDHKPIRATIGEIRKSVEMLKLSRSKFVDTILGKLPPTPPNHLIIAERNQSGDFSGIDPVDLEAGANRCAVA